MLPALNVMPTAFLSTTVASLLGPASLLALLSTLLALVVLVVGLAGESRRERRRALGTPRAARVPRSVFRSAA